MPEIVQFKNGNQIVNKYDAGGRKLATRYKTVYYQLAQPLNPGEVIAGLDVSYEDDVMIEGTDYVGNIEYFTSRFFDFDLTWAPVESYYADKVFFNEGYVQGFNLVNSTPRFNYYRRDHLGNNREVWMAAYTFNGQARAATTIQRTQYYPSGLPWKSITTDSPNTQNRKYNGKEFVEMHGLDEYDSEARWYYPAIMRTTTMDPLAEKYYGISPYAWCGNNPVKYTDPTGMEVEADSKSQSNTINTISKRERKYVRFDKNGVLDKKYLRKSWSLSKNMRSLNRLAKSKVVYNFQVVDKDHEGGSFYNKSDVGGNFYRGIAEIHGAESNTSPDN